MRADPGFNESNLSEFVTIDHKYAIGFHVRDVKDLAVWRDANILGHSPLRHFQIPGNLVFHEINFCQATGEFTGKNRVAPIDGKVGVVDPAAVRSLDGVFERHGVRIAQVEPLQRFGDDDRRAAVRHEVHVVRIVHGYGLAGFARDGVNGSDAAVISMFGIVVYSECL